jgi:hypothetical protein
LFFGFWFLVFVLFLFEAMKDYLKKKRSEIDVFDFERKNYSSVACIFNDAA